MQMQWLELRLSLMTVRHVAVRMAPASQMSQAALQIAPEAAVSAQGPGESNASELQWLRNDALQCQVVRCCFTQYYTIFWQRMKDI